MIASSGHDSPHPGLEGHICLVVDGDRDYAAIAEGFLAEAAARGEKPVTFGPQGSRVQERLRPLAAIAADPYVEVLGGGRLAGEPMFAMFREQAAKARDEGYRRLRVAADMDWLLPAVRTRDEAVRFEVLLDRVVAELGATVMCAYRRTSFPPETILGMLCTHPVTVGADEPEPFKLVAGDGGCYTLSGELDAAVCAALVPALEATATDPWVVDASGLVFADVAGMRAIETAADNAGRALHVRGASARLRRYWRLAGFEHDTARVTFQGAAATG